MNDCTDSSIVHVVTRNDEGDGQDVVREHLPVVLSWLFGMNDV